MTKKVLLTNKKIIVSSVPRSSTTAFRTREISAPLQMSLRFINAPAAKLCLCISPKSTQRSELSWLPANSAQVVSLISLLSGPSQPFLNPLCFCVLRSAGPLATRSKLGREEIKWQELLLHFRFVQAKHEKAHRQALGALATDTASFSGFSEKTGGGSGGGETSSSAGGRQAQGSSSGIRPPMRRRVTGEVLAPSAAVNVPPRGVLSPLNPRARQSGPTPSGLNPQGVSAGMGQGQLGKQQQQQQLRTMSTNKKL